MDYSVHGILQARILEGVAFPFSKGSSQPGIESRSPALQVASLPAEPQGKSKNTGVGSLSLLQQTSLTQESNWGLLHYRQILYQLSYQGSPLDSLARYNIYAEINFHSGFSILKKISPGISLEGMMLKLKLQYFGHLMRRVDSLEKTLMLGGIRGRRRRG